MDLIIKQIMDIDERASGIIEKTKVYIEENEKSTKADIESIRADTLDGARKKGTELYESVIKEAREESLKIAASSKEQQDILEKGFLKAKDILESRIFQEIFDSVRDSHE